MKNHRTFRMALAVGMVLLLGVCPAIAQTLVIFDPPIGTNAVSIQNLRLGDDFYDVEFVRGAAIGIYAGDDPLDPPIFDFTTSPVASEAVENVANALNLAGAETVGPFIASTEFYNVPFDLEGISPSFAIVQQGDYSGGNWGRVSFPSNVGYADLSTYATFTVVPELGDFDGNGIVDGQDFLLWQRDTSVGALADWEANYGMGATLSANSATVPEPTTATLALAALCLVVGRRRIAA